jgi:hypothetical protein
LPLNAVSVTVRSLLLRTPNVRAKLIIVVVSAACALSAFAEGAGAEFRRLYDYYFPKGSTYLEGRYREYFDNTLFGPAPPKSSDSRTMQLYSALRGSRGAFHKFVHNSDREGMGEFGEDWSAECLLLLLRLGDEDFSQLLSSEDRTTREAVGGAIDGAITCKQHLFVKTRSLYSYRYVPMSKEELQERARIKTVSTVISLGPDEFSRLKTVLAKDVRFRSAYVHRTDNAKGFTFISVPKALSKEDISDLKHLISQVAPSQQDIRFQ